MPKTKTESKEMNTPKTMTKNENTLDKINNKIDMINKLHNGLEKVRVDIATKIELIYEAMVELQDEIYSDDS